MGHLDKFDFRNWPRKRSCSSSQIDRCDRRFGAIEGKVWILLILSVACTVKIFGGDATMSVITGLGAAGAMKAAGVLSL